MSLDDTLFSPDDDKPCVRFLPPNATRLEVAETGAQRTAETP